jgi:2-oxo-4-hydroxy-4-carboxy--5-ureidoimidazoline (OHCU) decarboxylase
MSLPEKLPPISTLPSLPSQSRAQILDLLFEPCPALHTLALPLTSPTSAITGSSTTDPFTSYDDLIIAVGTSLNALSESTSSSDRKWLDNILAAHPKLGEKKVDSALSRVEQAAMAAASASQDDASKAEAEELARLNDEYEAAFPGLRYVVFVAGRPRRVIMEDMRTRIRRGDGEMERREAIKVSGLCGIDMLRERVLLREE